MIRKKSIVSLLAITLILFGCTSHPPLTLEALKNAQYKAEDFEGVIQLKDSKYEGAPYVEGAASRPVFTLSGVNAFGDLNRGF
ncbi:hypothetical protein ACFL6S_21170 [Candidatus Poribacteria bacterium]